MLRGALSFAQQLVQLLLFFSRSLTIYLFSLIFVSIAKGRDRTESLLPYCLVNTGH
jgi:hypothetical protein